MGKVKVKIVGDEQQEQEALAEQKQKREQREKSREAGSGSARKASVKGVNLGGGERINSVGASEEEILAQMEAESKPSEDELKVEATESDEPMVHKEKKPRRKVVARARSERHTQNTGMVAAKTAYPIANGLEILRKFKKSKFDETVELHINVKEKGTSGQVSLPHGTGKQLRIKIADDAAIEQIEKGKIDFDVLVATPDIMPKLARVARVLGPRGLMPNPKNGTISPKPEEVVEKLSKGQVSYKTEAAAPIIHMSVGKLSFDDQKLAENISAVLGNIGASKINNITLKSTMSPAILIQA